MKIFLAIIFTSQVLGDATYSDDIARNRLWPAAASTYSSNPEKCFHNAFVNATLYKRYDIACDILHTDTCCGLLALDHESKAIMVIFRGTTSMIQLMEEGDESVFMKKSDWTAGGKVAKYFNDGFFRIWNGGMKDGFMSLKHQYPDYELRFTGHSLGGAMATLACSYLINTKLADPANTKIVTFGEPRVGDKTFAKMHDTQLDYHFRVTHKHDIVPHSPAEMYGYYQHLNEVFYNNDMTPGASFTVCNGDEDAACSDGELFNTSWMDHFYYFNHDYLLYGDGGCK